MTAVMLRGSSVDRGFSGERAYPSFFISLLSIEGLGGALPFLTYAAGLCSPGLSAKEADPKFTSSSTSMWIIIIISMYLTSVQDPEEDTVSPSPDVTLLLTNDQYTDEDEDEPAPAPLEATFVLLEEEEYENEGTFTLAEDEEQSLDVTYDTSNKISLDGTFTYGNEEETQPSLLDATYDARYKTFEKSVSSTASSVSTVPVLNATFDQRLMNQTFDTNTNESECDYEEMNQTFDTNNNESKCDYEEMWRLQCLQNISLELEDSVFET